MELIILVILTLMVLGAFKAKSNNEKPEVLLDCSNELCKWNDNNPCPYKMVRYKGQRGFRRRVEGIHECCRTRQARVRMAKLVVDGKLNTDGGNIIISAIECLERHKLEHPEEHEYLFGEK